MLMQTIRHTSFLHPIYFGMINLVVLSCQEVPLYPFKDNIIVWYNRFYFCYSAVSRSQETKSGSPYFLDQYCPPTRYFLFIHLSDIKKNIFNTLSNLSKWHTKCYDHLKLNDRRGCQYFRILTFNSLVLTAIAKRFRQFHTLCWPFKSNYSNMLDTGTR